MAAVWSNGSYIPSLLSLLRLLVLLLSPQAPEIKSNKLFNTRNRCQGFGIPYKVNNTTRTGTVLVTYSVSGQSTLAVSTIFSWGALQKVKIMKNGLNEARIAERSSSAKHQAQKQGCTSDPNGPRSPCEPLGPGPPRAPGAPSVPAKPGNPLAP